MFSIEKCILHLHLSSTEATVLKSYARTCKRVFVFFLPGAASAIADSAEMRQTMNSAALILTGLKKKTESYCVLSEKHPSAPAPAL